MPIGLQSMILELAVLAALSACVIGLALYRYFVAREQDVHLHYQVTEAQTVGKQSNIITQLSAIDKWGKILTVLTVAYFLVLLCVVLYQEWGRAGTLG
jgi:hypothetical protein